MTDWKAEVAIKHLLVLEGVDVQEVGRQVGKGLRKLLGRGLCTGDPEDGELLGLCQCFEDEESMENLECFNSAMVELYDWADKERVWIK